MRGPKWQPTKRGDEYLIRQADSNGVVWDLVGRKDCGRTLQWLSRETPSCSATTTATPAHPGYPTDDAVAAEQKLVDSEAREQRRAYARMGLIP